MERGRGKGKGRERERVGERDPTLLFLSSTNLLGLNDQLLAVDVHKFGPKWKGLLPHIVSVRRQLDRSRCRNQREFKRRPVKTDSGVVVELLISVTQRKIHEFLVVPRRRTIDISRTLCCPLYGFF